MDAPLSHDRFAFAATGPLGFAGPPLDMDGFGHKESFAQVVPKAWAPNAARAAAAQVGHDLSPGVGPPGTQTASALDVPSLSPDPLVAEHSRALSLGWGGTTSECIS